MLKMLQPKKTSRQIIEEHLEQLWRTDPKQFDAGRNCREKERIERTLKLVPQPENKMIVDAGCGNGEIALYLQNLGATVHALDCSSVPLSHLQNTSIKTFQDCLPKTILNDAFYDIVVCTDVLAYLPPQEHRLLMWELSRIVKKDGYIICSTPLDIDSENPLAIFEALFQTEFEIVESIYSYHAWQIKIRNALKYLGIPFLKNNRTFLLAMEHMTKFFKGEKGMSHVICLGKRKSWR